MPVSIDLVLPQLFRWVSSLIEVIALHRIHNALSDISSGLSVGEHICVLIGSISINRATYVSLSLSVRAHPLSARQLRSLYHLRTPVQ